jgi:hypothetical protein
LGTLMLRAGSPTSGRANNFDPGHFPAYTPSIFVKTRTATDLLAAVDALLEGRQFVSFGLSNFN